MAARKKKGIIKKSPPKRISKKKLEKPLGIRAEDIKPGQVFALTIDGATETHIALQDKDGIKSHLRTILISGHKNAPCEDIILCHGTWEYTIKILEDIKVISKWEGGKCSVKVTKLRKGGK